MSIATQSWPRGVRAFFQDIHLAHSVFALPFAFVGLILTPTPTPSLAKVGLIVLAMISARSFAMGMNRYLDRNVDRANPRTQNRALPRGLSSPALFLAVSCAMGALFILVSVLLSPLAGMLSPPLLLFLALYSSCKHWTFFAHYYLGVCLGLAPVAISIALTDTISWPIVLVGAAVAFWTAGFDILYSLQDLSFDRSRNLKSIPVRFGVKTALMVSRLSFAAMVGLLAIAGHLASRGLCFFLGVALVGAILVYEQWLVRDVDNDGQSDKIGRAFFQMNGWVSILFLTFVLCDEWWL